MSPYRAVRAAAGALLLGAALAACAVIEVARAVGNRALATKPPTNPTLKEVP